MAKQTTTCRALYTIDETAEIARAPKSTVRHWIATGALHSVRPGRLRLVPRSSLASFLGVSADELPPT